MVINKADSLFKQALSILPLSKLVLIAFLASTSFLFLAVPLALAAPCDPPVTNPVACENTLTGNPSSEWNVSGSGSSNIQGFATDISVNKGGTINFKVKTTATNYRFDIYRIGYYGGMGARKIATVSPSAALPQTQPNCLTQSATRLYDCGNWAVSGSWSVPVTAVSGVYVAKLVALAGTTGSSHIHFIVRDDSSSSDVVFQTSDLTWEAYNNYGGSSTYEFNSPSGVRAYKVSYNRPMNTRGSNPITHFYQAEYPMVRWLERNGYNLSYISGVDTDRFGSLLSNHRVFLSVGHDEYWSGNQRLKVEEARDNGVNLAFLSGNEMFWKTRWENSIDSSNTPYRTMVVYKETHANAKIDPSSTWTGTWRDPRFSPPADGGRPENGLTGVLFMTQNFINNIKVPYADGRMRLWRNTPIANMLPGQVTDLATSSLGYEADEDQDNGFRPAGLFHLSTTTYTAERLQDYGSGYSGGASSTHHLTLYRALSGALVFGAGTIHWSWGLDNVHDAAPYPAPPQDPKMQQAMVNLFADMGVQPGTLQANLVTASASTDTVAPTSLIVSPLNNSNVAANSNVTISGVAIDTGGGVVGGVEVSTNNGLTWHPATGRENWSYSWTTPSFSTVVIKSRAVDDSANLESPSAGITVTVGSGGGGPTPTPTLTPTPTVIPTATPTPTTGPTPTPTIFITPTPTQIPSPTPIPTPTVVPTATPTPGATVTSLWPNTTPTTFGLTDTQSVELGVKFRSTVPGYIKGIRFYRHAQQTGTFSGSLWNVGGTSLATANFSSLTPSGWQQVNFSTSVAIAANTTYVASYHASNGRYAFSSNYFATSAYTNGNLTALRNGTDGSNGIYRYTSSILFPNQTYQSSNYWVDVIFSTTP